MCISYTQCTVRLCQLHSQTLKPSFLRPAPASHTGAYDDETKYWRVKYSTDNESEEYDVEDMTSYVRRYPRPSRMRPAWFICRQTGQRSGNTSTSRWAPSGLNDRQAALAMAVLVGRLAGDLTFS